MKALFKKYMWLQIVFGILIAGVGIATIILAFVNGEIIDRTLSIIIAVALFVFSSIMFFSSLFAETKSVFSIALVYGSLFVALGVVLLVNPSLISTIIVTLLAVFIIAYGAINIFKGVTLILYRAKWYWVAILFFLGTVGIVGGILALCYPGVAFTVTFVILGVGLVCYGIFEIVMAILAINKVKTAQEINIEVTSVETSQQ